MQTMTEVQRIAAFADGQRGGNPAGVVIGDSLPEPAEMQAVAAEVGYSETVFAARQGDRWRVRYFAPAIEVDFCGHATIALGAALAAREGDGVFPLQLNQTQITVEGRVAGKGMEAALQSPSTWSRAANPELVREALTLFGWTPADLDARIPPALAHGGANHLVLALTSRERLAGMRYDFAAGEELARRAELTTFSLIFAESAQRFHARNPFPAGGIYEDPATGAGAAALAGYLRDLGWMRAGEIEILQGSDMGSPSRLRAEWTAEPGASIRVSGAARWI
ncbi:MAG TPA: PhzF family phenazine biosynthesis protein [Acidobacteriaceae bacterium]|nr:PhzF family phenazine biosynthesis protein [Acidobacteriaceae bacterium]